MAEGVSEQAKKAVGHTGCWRFDCDNFGSGDLKCVNCGGRLSEETIKEAAEMLDIDCVELYKWLQQTPKGQAWVHYSCQKQKVGT